MTDTLFDEKEIAEDDPRILLGMGLAINVSEGFPQKAE